MEGTKKYPSLNSSSMSDELMDAACSSHDFHDFHFGHPTWGVSKTDKYGLQCEGDHYGRWMLDDDLKIFGISLRLSVKAPYSLKFEAEFMELSHSHRSIPLPRFSFSLSPLPTTVMSLLHPYRTVLPTRPTQVRVRIDILLPPTSELHPTFNAEPTSQSTCRSLPSYLSSTSSGITSRGYRTPNTTGIASRRNPGP